MTRRKVLALLLAEMTEKRDYWKNLYANDSSRKNQLLFQPNRKYTLDEIEKIAKMRPTRTAASYAVVYSVLDYKRRQYDFILYPYNDGDSYILVSVDGESPANITQNLKSEE